MSMNQHSKDLIVLLITGAALIVLLVCYLRAREPRHRAISGMMFWNNQEFNGMSKILHLGNTSTASVAYQDKEGDTVPVVGAPKWSAAPDGLVTLAVADDGMSATVTPVAVGDVTITVVAEGDETAGVDTITLTGDVTVASEEASGGTLTFS